MRTEFLGGVRGAVADLNIYSGMWFRSGSAADEGARELVMRYSMAIHTLLYKDARGHSSLDDMVNKGPALAARGGGAAAALQVADGLGVDLRLLVARALRRPRRARHLAHPARGSRRPSC